MWDAVAGHRAHLGDDGLVAGRARRRRAELEAALAAGFRRRAAETLEQGEWAESVRAVEAGTADPWNTAIEIADV